jgi:small subunit ribosomal protein S8
MLSSIKNAAMAGNLFVETYYSKECESVAKVLKEAGFLSEVKVFKPKGKGYKGLRLDLVMKDEEPVLSNIIRVSKPGRRMYMGSDDIKPVKGGHGVLILSTSKGIMSGMEAKKRKLGGEVICRVY